MNLRRFLSGIKHRRIREYREKEKTTAKQDELARAARLEKASVCNHPKPRTCPLSARVQGEARCGASLTSPVSCPYKGKPAPFKAKIQEEAKQAEKKKIIVEEPPEVEV